MAPCRRTLGRERHRHAFARRDKLGTDPMAVHGVLCGRRHSREKREEGEKPVSKHPSEELQNERADA